MEFSFSQTKQTLRNLKIKMGASKGKLKKIGDKHKLHHKEAKRLYKKYAGGSKLHPLNYSGFWEMMSDLKKLYDYPFDLEESVLRTAFRAIAVGDLIEFEIFEREMKTWWEEIRL
jgi:hypothetical protein